MTPKRWLYGLLGIFVILGLAYGLTIPLFESSDEFSHLQVIRYFANEGTLSPPVFPDRRADSRGAMAWFLTFHDPPLYYAPPTTAGWEGRSIPARTGVPETLCSTHSN